MGGEQDWQNGCFDSFTLNQISLPARAPLAMALNMKHFLGGTKLPMEDGGRATGRNTHSRSALPAVQFLACWGISYQGREKPCQWFMVYPKGTEHRASKAASPILGLS